MEFRIDVCVVVKQLFFWRVSVLWGKLNIDFLTVSGLWFDPCVQRQKATPPLASHKKKASQRLFYKYGAKDVFSLPFWSCMDYNLACQTLPGNWGDPQCEYILNHFPPARYDYLLWYLMKQVCGEIALLTVWWIIPVCILNIFLQYCKTWWDSSPRTFPLRSEWRWQVQGRQRASLTLSHSLWIRPKSDFRYQLGAAQTYTNGLTFSFLHFST